MANIGQNGFDATQVEPITDFDTLSAGKYTAEISDLRINYCIIFYVLKDVVD